MICGRHFSFITIASIRFLKWFTTDFLHFNACILPSIIRHIMLHRGIRGMISGMVWPWFGHSSLNHNEHAVSHAVSRIEMPPVPEYASSVKGLRLNHWTIKTNQHRLIQLTCVQRGSYGYGIIEHSLSDRACVAWFEYGIGYLATLVPVGSMHRAW